MTCMVSSPCLLQPWQLSTCACCASVGNCVDCCAGFSSSKAAVPIKERAQQAWFMSQQQPELPCRVLASMPSPLGPQTGSPSYLQDLWAPSFECFQQVMGGVNGLRQASQDSLHSDISQREVSQMCGVVEHAWYMLRQQHIAIRDGCEQLCVIEHSVELLESAAGRAQECFQPRHSQALLQYASCACFSRFRARLHS